MIRPAHTLALLAAGTLCAATGPDPELAKGISAASLRANLSFLASDALEGRATPSRGLDTAAEFIGSRFREAGLEPIFQTARFAQIANRLEDFRLTLETSRGKLELTGNDVRVRSLSALELRGASVLKLPENGAIPPVEGRVVAGESKQYGGEAMLALLQSRRPSAILLISKDRGRPGGAANAGASYLKDTEAREAPVFRISNDDALESLHGEEWMKLSVHLSSPERRDATVANVAAILPGSDAALRDQYVMVTAHYDHLGMKESGEGDRIYNGANDDGSGTVCVIELARALAALPARPRRSIIFVAFFGEEEGLLGSFYYAKHPLVPLKSTVADVNLEQMGRTDDTDGKRAGEFAFTGAAYSGLPKFMAQAASAEGVKVYTNSASNAFFARSDNYALALAGVVAHTIAVAFDYHDYHEVGDEWQKIDYDNMAKVDRAIAAGLIELGNTSALPAWSGSAEAAQYREAGR